MMSDNTELAKRLRNFSLRPVVRIAETEALMDKAATALEASATLEERLAETAMLSYKWMQAHDRLKDGIPYDYPKPADLPDCLAENARLREALEAENKRLRARLEIDHCYRLIDGEMVRVELTPDEGNNFPDAITCRDATIALLEEDVVRLRAVLTPPKDTP